MLELRRHSVCRDDNRGHCLCHRASRRRVGVQSAPLCVLYADCTVQRRHDKTRYIDIACITVRPAQHSELRIGHALDDLITPPAEAAQKIDHATERETRLEVHEYVGRVPGSGVHKVTAAPMDVSAAARALAVRPDTDDFSIRTAVNRATSGCM